MKKIKCLLFTICFSILCGGVLYADMVVEPSPTELALEVGAGLLLLMGGVALVVGIVFLIKYFINKNKKQ